jgi:hypothetical protein
MQAWLSLLFGDEVFVEHLRMNGAATAAAAALCKNFLRDIEKV